MAIVNGVRIAFTGISLVKVMCVAVDVRAFVDTVENGALCVRIGTIGALGGSAAVCAAVVANLKLLEFQ